MQLACHDLLVCKYLTLYIRVLLFIMCFKFFHHAPLGNQFVLKELACLNKVLPTYLVIVIRNYCAYKFEPSGDIRSKSQRKVYFPTFVKLTCVISNCNNFRARIFNQIQIPASGTSRSRGSRLRRSPLASRDRLVGKSNVRYDIIRNTRKYMHAATPRLS